MWHSYSKIAKSFSHFMIVMEGRSDKVKEWLKSSSNPLIVCKEEISWGCQLSSVVDTDCPGVQCGQGLAAVHRCYSPQAPVWGGSWAVEKDGKGKEWERRGCWAEFEAVDVWHWLKQRHLGHEAKLVTVVSGQVMSAGLINEEWRGRTVSLRWTRWRSCTSYSGICLVT